ncbi:hypothetical protein GN330_16435 [Nitratireductor sp. CAU 1489]|uniref:SGNH hydrolase-type esterase domain-containing protein n=1 Tax=Nitratireductor arenosus TaxID=2682096 RepID=A0A844QFU7_9HYPH|nr:hypothetical protein [Nitratireductor arenosus]MVA98836.1 hypothetical protein [Nitratireductor arenosus]
MSVFTKLAASIFAPQDAGGTPRGVVNGEAQTWGTELERIIDAAVAAGNFLIYETKAALDADLAHDASTAALVIGDSTSNDGLYVKSGASGAGSWSRVGDVPGYSFIRATDAGGSANAIAATTALPINESQLIVLPINLTNTGTPVTVSFNGGSALTIKTAAGNNPAIGGLVGGTAVAGYKDGSTFQMLSDQASTAIQAAAEAAQAASEAARDDAEAARDAAQAAVSSVVPNVFADIATVGAYNPTVAPDFVAVSGWDEAGDENLFVMEQAGSDDGNGANIEVSLDPSGSQWYDVVPNRPLVLPAFPAIVDMHYGVLKGTGWNSADPEDGGIYATTTSASASAGAYALVVAAAAEFYENQLIVYLGTDGLCYTAVIKSISSLTLNLKGPLEAAVASGAHVSNFYNDQAHPNKWGYYAIADFMLRNVGKRYRLAHRWVTGDDYIPVGSPTESALSALSYDNPGSTTKAARKFVATIALDGMKTPTFSLPAGNYVCRVVMTPNTESGSADSAKTRVTVLQGGSAISLLEKTHRHPTVFELAFNAKHLSTLQVSIGAQAIGVGFAVALIEILSVEEQTPDYGNLLTVALGDSWVAFGHITDRILARKPTSKLIQEGVGGNKMSDLLGRFAADVEAHSPRRVLMMAGTNDYYTPVSTSSYETSARLLQTRISEIGADCIMFTPSVGTDAHTTAGDGLTPSRNYMLDGRYWSEIAGVVGPTETIAVSINKRVEQNTTETIFSIPATTMFGVRIKRLYVTGFTGNITYGFGGSTTSVAEDSGTLALGSVHTNVTVTKPTNKAARFFNMVVTEPNVSDEEMTGYAVVEYIPA